MSSSGIISFQSRVVVAAEVGSTNGLGQDLPRPSQEFQQQEYVPPTFSRGGLPIISVQYSDVGDFLTVVVDGMPTLTINITQVPSWIDITTTETYINAQIERYLEVWTPISSLPKDDPVRNGILNDNERIESQGRDYLVTTLGYGAIHIFSLSPLKFTTRFNGLDSGPVTGTWW